MIVSLSPKIVLVPPRLLNKDCTPLLTKSFFGCDRRFCFSFFFFFLFFRFNHYSGSWATGPGGQGSGLAPDFL